MFLLPKIITKMSLKTDFKNNTYKGKNGYEKEGSYIKFVLKDKKSAQDRSRTGTSVTSQVFETSASTNSATWAINSERLRGCNISQCFF